MVDRVGPRQLMRSFMYGHPRRRGGGRLAIAVVLVSLLLLAIALMLRSTIVLRAGTAASDPLIVAGTIYDSSGNPVDGADVTVTVIGSISPSPSQDTVSMVGGFYTVTFDMTEWQIGDIVKVAASFGGESGENQSAADTAYPEIDVHLVASIPELHGSASVMLTVGAIMALILLVSRRRR